MNEKTTIITIKAKNWQNLAIFFKLLTFTIANILFYLGALGYIENGQYLGIYIAFVINNC
jgi:uncharacterized protein involved in response to NO